ncbi:RNA-binding protein hfq [Nodosilinea sp. FACHB-131]|jgi:host factor-I protein|uniref:RNA-binding protein hfq n=1 Tax=Phormidium tenue NIES-30 TaxID=549789 RepID=A0A1U7JAJ4_9CYAN|nr:MULTISPECIES: RNA-binding protein hfq [Cyanophyceae]MBD1876278.1 RNA-binding protein hfq [Nodosilinea sp. FACHB-131]MBD2230400.1 RNA-binding protein hfq [Phormidium tenue FACHB-1052]MBW4460231.1 RNA-binding protein hfq [Nodosilinea sp. WJT8-NPBG4]OKH50804.1 RNA-binding protein hfq [Phormidium tenue NIES-30]
MSQEFATGLPSVRQVQNLIRDHAPIEVKLITGDVITGRVVWQDPQCICIQTEDQSKHQIWKQAIGFLKYS